MQAITYNPTTNLWQQRELPIPTPHEHDVLIRVAACALNPVDAKIARWQALAPHMDEHWVGGLDVSGTVVAVGAAVKNWKEGDRVLTHGNMLRPCGGFAEFTLQDARTLVPHPTHLSPEQAAATPCAGWTAWRALHDKLRLHENADRPHTLIIAGASGGVGSFALQIARHLRVKTIIAISSARNAPLTRQLGATHTLDYATDNLCEAVRTITQGAGITHALDCIGGDTNVQLANSLAYEGQLLSLVGLATPDQYDRAFLKGLTFHQLSLGSAHREAAQYGQTQLTRTAAAFNTALAQGHLQIPPLQTITLAQTPAALTAMQNQHTTGKIVLSLEH